MVKPPNIERIKDTGRGLGLHLDEEEARTFAGLMRGTLASYERLDRLAEPTLPVKYPRSGGYRPAPEENQLNAWYWKCSIKGAESGPLSGKRIAIKDNV